MTSPSAVIADIRRLTIHDGPGTRDTVFVKGCPLRCIWCHNPESISPKPQLAFHGRLCLACGQCADVCPRKVHAFEDGKHTIDRMRCTSCGKCAEECLPGALAMCGKTMSPEQAYESAVRDRDFFGTDGGVTLSGGEPLLYPDFAAAFFRMLREAGIHTALDTCGAIGFAAFEKVLPFTDLVLFDIKGMDPVRHANSTGSDNALILGNLERIGAGDVPIEIRMPIIPKHNDDPEEIERAGEFLAKLPAVRTIRLLAYHSMARDKYAIHGLKDTMPEVKQPSSEQMESIARTLRTTSRKAVVI